MGSSNRSVLMRMPRMLNVQAPELNRKKGGKIREEEEKVNLLRSS